MEKIKPDLLSLVQTSLATALEKEIHVQPGTRLRADLGVQSIDIIDFIFVLEKAVEIPIDLEEFFDFISSKSGGKLAEIVVSDIISYLEHKLK